MTNYHTANTFPTIRSTDDHSTVAINPTSIIDPTQQCLPPVPQRLREHIITGEFIDFITLLPKAVFSSSIELDNVNSFTVQLPSNSGNVQFWTLAASDPALQWDMRHADLWLQCLTPTSTQQPKRWPCIHCGATNHYLDHCPFRPHIAKQTPGGPGDINRGQLNIRTPTTATPTHSNHTSFNSPTRYCWDFNRATCQRLQCKFAH